MKFTPAGIITATFFAFLPFITTNQVFYGPVNAKFFFVIVAVDILVLILAQRFSKRKEGPVLRGRWLLGSLATVMLVQFLAVILGVFPERSLWSDIFWSSGVLFLLHVGVFAWVLSELVTEQDWSLIRRSIAISAGFFASLLIIGRSGIGVTGEFLWSNLNDTGLTFGNETYAGTYLLLAFVVGLVELFRTSGWGRGRVALLASVVLIALSPLLFNFGLLLGRVPLEGIISNPASLLGLARASSAALFWTIGFLAGYFIIRKFAAPHLSGRLAAAWGIALTAATAALVALLFVPGSLVQEAYIKESTAARIIVWDASVQAIQDRPLLGWGPENFNYALERHFDARLFHEENLAEIWFERAHNGIIDTLVGSGYIGLVSFAFLAGTYGLILYRARRRGLIGDTEMALLIAVVPAHVLQLQTGFDTIGSYILLGFIGGYALWLEKNLAEEVPPLVSRTRTFISLTLVLLAVVSLVFVLVGEYTRQAALPATFKGRTLSEQQANMEKSLERVSSFESLRLSSSSFIKGSLLLLSEAPSRDREKKILEVAHRYEQYYVRYLERQPDHYRANMNYAYLLLIMTTLGEDRTEDAKRILARGYELSPNHPLTYIMDALAELYQGNLDESRRLMAEARAIDPDVEFTQEAEIYFAQQWEQFPNITVMKLTNL